MAAITASRCLGALALTLCVSANALAQSPSTPTQTGQITIERVEQGFVFAPDARITEVDGRTATLVGGYAGWMTDRTWVVGGAGYWLANQDDDFEMAYGGMVVEYLARSQQRIGFGVRGLVGGGSATLGSTVGEYFGVDGDIGLPVRDPRHGGASRMLRGGRGGHGGGAFPISSDTELLVHEYFFVVEPQASVIVHFTRWARLDLGVGYRLTAGAGALDEDLRGPSASIAVQFGGAKR